MDPDTTLFITIIIALSIGGWLINNWIRAKHGYALEDEWGGKTAPSDSTEAQRLRAENRELHGKIDAMQGRLVVLEQIVTDRGYALSAEIDALRSTPVNVDAGVPLGLEKQERV